MTSNIIKFSKRSISSIKKHRKEKVRYNCTDCQRLYISENMMSHRSAGWDYYKETSKWFCIRCFNKRFS
jgi:transposase-like protein